jgi:hypothetical protein
MPSEIMKLTAQIVTSHASMSELTPKELVEELKEVYLTLNAVDLTPFVGPFAVAAF